MWYSTAHCAVACNVHSFGYRCSVAVATQPLHANLVNRFNALRILHFSCFHFCAVHTYHANDVAIKINEIIVATSKRVVKQTLDKPVMQPEVCTWPHSHALPLYHSKIKGWGGRAWDAMITCGH